MSWPAAAGTLALVCLAAYWNSFRAELLLDSQTIILKDPRLTSASWQSVRDIFAYHYWWPSLESHLYRPVTTLTYWLNYAVLGNGPHPAGYHAVNLLLHAANALLVFALVRGVSGRPWAALASAAVFASHPLTVEAVTNVVGRADLLAAMSVVGGLLIYRRFLASAGWRRTAWLAGLGLVYLAGVFCKESAVVLPGAMLLHDLAFPFVSEPSRAATVRRSLARAWPAYAAVLPGLAVLLWARWIMFRDSPLFGQFGSDNPIVIAPLWTGVMTAVKVAGYYLALLVWPARLSCDYSYNAVTLFGWTLTDGQDPHAWAALAVLLGLLAASVAAWRRDRAVWFFLGFAAAALLPTSNLLFPIGTIMAERLTYLPLAGAAAAGVLALAALEQRMRAASPVRSRRAIGIAWKAAAVLVIAALTARTVLRNEDWTSDLRLWSTSAQAAPNNVKIHRALAAIAMESDPSGGRHRRGPAARDGRHPHRRRGPAAPAPHARRAVRGDGRLPRGEVGAVRRARAAGAGSGRARPGRVDAGARRGDRSRNQPPGESAAAAPRRAALRRSSTAARPASTSASGGRISNAATPRGPCPRWRTCGTSGLETTTPITCSAWRRAAPRNWSARAETRRPPANTWLGRRSA